MDGCATTKIDGIDALAHAHAHPTQQRIQIELEVNSWKSLQEPVACNFLLMTENCASHLQVNVMSSIHTSDNFWKQFMGLARRGL
jgi:hypothetical protein